MEGAIRIGYIGNVGADLTGQFAGIHDATSRAAAYPAT